MKKILTSLGVCSLFLFSVVLAQPLAPTENFDVGGEEMSRPPAELDAELYEENQMVDGYSYKVYNVSQKNADATVSGARVGDVLRYEFIINSPKNDVTNFVVSLDISDIENNAEIIDTGLGDVNQGIIKFPAFTQQAPCSKVFSFFVRIKDCSGDKNITTSGHGQNISVALNCELAKSGPSNKIMIYILLGIVSFVMFGVLSKRKQL